jgi:hypothetical protein
MLQGARRRALAALLKRRKRQSEEPDSAEVHFRGKSQEEFQV